MRLRRLISRFFLLCLFVLTLIVPTACVTNHNQQRSPSSSMLSFSLANISGIESGIESGAIVAGEANEQVEVIFGKEYARLTLKLKSATQEEICKEAELNVVDLDQDQKPDIKVSYVKKSQQSLGFSCHVSVTHKRNSLPFFFDSFAFRRSANAEYFSLESAPGLVPRGDGGVGILINYHNTWVGDAPARLFVEFVELQERGPKAFLRPDKNGKTCPSKVTLHGEGKIQELLPKTPLAIGLVEVGFDNHSICGITMDNGQTEALIPGIKNEFRANFSLDFIPDQDIQDSASPTI